MLSCVIVRLLLRIISPYERFILYNHKLAAILFYQLRFHRKKEIQFFLKITIHYAHTLALIYHQFRGCLCTFFLRSQKQGVCYRAGFSRHLRARGLVYIAVPVIANAIAYCAAAGTIYYTPRLQCIAEPRNILGDGGIEDIRPDKCIEYMVCVYGKQLAFPLVGVYIEVSHLRLGPDYHVLQGDSN